MSKTKLNNEEIKQWYISSFGTFENSLNGNRETPFHEIRKSAISRFSDNGFPNTRDEEWKYTSVAPLLRHKFNLATKGVAIPASILDELTYDGLRDNLIVMVNGRYAPSYSTLKLDKPGVIVASLADAMTEHSGLIFDFLAKHADFEQESFTALNTAFASDGLFFYVPDNVEVDETIHVIHISDSSQETFVSHPRNLLVLGRNSKASVMETFYGVGDGVYFNNLVGEMVLNANSRLEHLRVQEEGREAYHISSVNIHQERDSVFSTVNIELGGALVRNNTKVRLNDENCETHLFGFFMGRGTQHIDNHTSIDHAKPNCFSNELYKGILDDKARGVFNGKIFVRQDAQKTNALQSNKTLLLTDDATINAKPQLEIFADDVKCTHGATIGQLDDEALYYLRTRGIKEEMASAMLRHAFISDVLNNIKNEVVREQLDHKIIDYFTNGK